MIPTMTTEPTSSSHSLPAIPTLPPIYIPGHDDDLNASSSPRLPPVTFSPQEPTSLTTSSPILTRKPSFTIRSSSAGSPLQHLRRSASVDSLPIRQPGDSSRSSSPTGARSTISTNTDSSHTRWPELSVGSRRRREPETIPPYARSRGHSVSTMSDGHDSAFEQDFESDSWRPLKRPVDKPRRTSVKGSEQARPSRRPGDLKLPSRNQPPPALFNQFAHPLPRDDTRRLHSTTSLQSFPKHSSLTDVMSGRVRSGSLGLQADPSSLGSRSLLIDVVQPKVSHTGIYDIHFYRGTEAIPKGILRCGCGHPWLWEVHFHRRRCESSRRAQHLCIIYARKSTSAISM